ncbi:hypothetical protein [Desertivirga xinjiangensis]|uniref:hypothetical protein n=1 Tax=Desertivirga xinjiangensis TaxID=539206 RepID=UPI00210A5259|nr:hypothetical protein [Pedobacter xinjiangensis]
MKLKTISEAKSILEKLTTLDAEIIQIEKKAIKIANGAFTSSITLEFDVEPESKPKNHAKQSRSGERQHLFFPGLLFSPEVPRWGEENIQNKNASDLSFGLEETEMLMVMGTLIAIKKQRRMGLLSKLKEMGVTF